MPRFQTADGVITQIKTTQVLNYVFETPSEVQLQYYNMFKAVDSAPQVGIEPQTTIVYDTRYQTYIDSIQTISINTEYVSNINLVKRKDVTLAENVFESLFRLQSLFSNDRSLWEYLSKSTEIISKIDPGIIGLKRDIIQQYVGEYIDSAGLFIDGKLDYLSRAKYISDKIASHHPDYVLSGYLGTVTTSLNNMISNVDDLLSQSGEYILGSKDPYSRKVAIDQLVRIASLADSKTEFVDLSKNVLNEEYGEWTVKASLLDAMTLISLVDETTLIAGDGEWTTGGGLIATKSDIDDTPVRIGTNRVQYRDVTVQDTTVGGQIYVPTIDEIMQIGNVHINPTELNMNSFLSLENSVTVEKDYLSRVNDIYTNYEHLYNDTPNIMLLTGNKVKIGDKVFPKISKTITQYFPIDVIREYLIYNLDNSTDTSHSNYSLYNPITVDMVGPPIDDFTNSYKSTVNAQNTGGNLGFILLTDQSRTSISQEFTGERVNVPITNESIRDITYFIDSRNLVDLPSDSDEDHKLNVYIKNHLDETLYTDTTIITNASSGNWNSKTISADNFRHLLSPTDNTLSVLYERHVPDIPDNPFENFDAVEIYNTWNRISHDSSLTYPASSSETNAWQLTASGDIQATVNSSTYIGFISPTTFTGYELEATMSSTNGDNDMISFVLGYFEENGQQHTLNFARIRSGMMFSSGWATGTNFGQVYGFGGGDTGVSPTGAQNFLNTGVVGTENYSGGWSSVETRVRVVKDPINKTIDIYATPYAASHNDALMTYVTTIDLDANDYMRKFQDSAFGFSCWSQNASSWTDISFTPTVAFDPQTVKEGEIAVGGLSVRLNKTEELLDMELGAFREEEVEITIREESVAPIYRIETNLYDKTPSDLPLITQKFIANPQDRSFSNKDYISLPTDESYIEKNLFYGPADSTNVPINNFYKKIQLTQEPKGNYVPETSDMVFPIKFMMEDLRDIVIDMTPQYKDSGDKTFIHKLFYVDLDNITTSYKLIPSYSVPNDKFFIPDTYLMRDVKNTSPNKKNIFGMKSELYKFFGGRVILDTASLVFYDHYSSMYGGMYNELEDGQYEYVYTGDFVGISMYTDLKDWLPTYHVIQSAHPRSGGSQAYGHDVIGNSTLRGSYKEIPHLGWIKENDILNSGRHGRSIAQEYRVTQVVRGRDEDNNLNATGLLYEFDYVYHDMDANSGGIGEGKYNFNYTLIDSKGRIPDCLELSDQTFVIGRIGENDQFLNKYKYENWVEEHGHLADGLDTDYTDFTMVDPRVFRAEALGIATTRGTLDIVLLMPGVDTQRFKIGDVLQQGTTTGTITDVLGEYQANIDLGDGYGEVPRTVVQYELQNIDGEYQELTKTVQYSFAAKSSKQDLIEDIALLQVELNNLSPADPRYDEVLEQIQQKNRELNLIGDYTYLVVTGTSISYDIAEVKNRAGLTLPVYRQEINTARGLRKFVELIFPVYNNWSYDRDRFLFTTDKLPEKLFWDGEYYEREKWIEVMRDAGFYRFDNDKNNLAVDELIETFKTEYANGDLNLTEEEYKEQLEAYESMISLGSIPESVEYLEDISPFKLNCTLDVTEKEFYEFSQDTRIIRGYPVYASCN